MSILTCIAKQVRFFVIAGALSLLLWTDPHDDINFSEQVSAVGGCYEPVLGYPPSRLGGR